MMRYSLLLLCVALIACARPRAVVSPGAADAADPTARLAEQSADAVLWQHSSAEAHRIQQQAFELARIRLAENLEGADPRPPAVIVDIDETVLDNSPYEVDAIRKGRTYVEADWADWTDRAAAKAVPGAVEFLRHAEALGCTVFYISNRSVGEHAATIRNLDSLGFPFADTTHVRLMNGVSDKTERRARVAASHRIVLLIGDQLRDFDERFKDRTVNHGKDLVDVLADTLQRYFILLPNPMYGTYRDAVQGKGTAAEKHARMKAYFEINGY